MQTEIGTQETFENDHDHLKEIVHREILRPLQTEIDHPPGIGTRSSTEEEMVLPVKVDHGVMNENHLPLKGEVLQEVAIIPVAITREEADHQVDHEMNGITEIM